MSKHRPATITSADDVGYLLSLVRVDIRKRERALAKFAPKPEQAPEAAAIVKQHLIDRLAFRRGVLARLRGGQIDKDE